jgi:hypothetical protein
MKSKKKELTEAQLQSRREKDKIRKKNIRSQESPLQTEQRKLKDKQWKQAHRKQESQEETEERLEKQKQKQRAHREQESQEETEERLEKDKILKRSKKPNLLENIHALSEDLDSLEEPSVLSHDQKRTIHSNLEECFTLDALIQRVC